MSAIKNLELVALLVDKNEHGLYRGDVGTVVEVFKTNEHHSSGYIVEFADEAGKTIALVDITDSTEIIRLRFHRQAA
ncbi:MAG: DUF4926 domain-containing protein [Pyrinomonadaceae bacterium]